MASSDELIARILSETLAAQNRQSPQYRERANGRYAPFGPYIPAPAGGAYPTTDAAMEALAELADRIRANDPALRQSNSRKAAHMVALQSLGEALSALVQEQDAGRHWPMLRERLIAALKHAPQDMVHYVPVWLFVRQECQPFSVGPVRFVQPADWLDVIRESRGEESSWMPGVRRAWMAGGNLDEADAKVKAVARAVHPDQWIACVTIKGFEKAESRRRGLLAIRVALDTIRLMMPAAQAQLISTSADHSAPIDVVRLNQVAGQDLSLGWALNMPGVGGAPGLAQQIVTEGAPLIEAAGACIATIAEPKSSPACPQLAERWFNAAHWFGRACVSDEDFVSVLMLVMALDILSDGKKARGIAELVARLTVSPLSKPVLPDGTTLNALVSRAYKLRSETAHGSSLAVFRDLEVERAHLTSLAAAALGEYVLRLADYAQGGGQDDPAAFLGQLDALQK